MSCNKSRNLVIWLIPVVPAKGSLGLSISQSWLVSILPDQDTDISPPWSSALIHVINGLATVSLLGTGIECVSFMLHNQAAILKLFNSEEPLKYFSGYGEPLLKCDQ